MAVSVATVLQLMENSGILYRCWRNLGSYDAEPSPILVPSKSIDQRGSRIILHYGRHREKSRCLLLCPVSGRDCKYSAQTLQKTEKMW